MTVYFYHNRPIEAAFGEFVEKKHPGHILYGVTEFHKYDIGVIFHKYVNVKKRQKRAFKNAVQIFFNRKHYDVLYGTHSYGLEFIILLKMLKLYKRPIILWQHRKVHSNDNYFINCFHRYFYRAVDGLIFFTNIHIEESIKTGNVKIEQCHVVKWGADLDFYNLILKDLKEPPIGSYISTGKENRDFITLIKAFSDTGATLDIYAPKANGEVSYLKDFESIGSIPGNVQIHIVEGVIPYDLAKKVATGKVVVICCTQQYYTVGLTTLVEALALGKPVIISDNIYYNIDIEKANCGIKVPYGDIKGWKGAIEYLESHEEIAKLMGQNARKLAEKEYNLTSFSKEVINVFNIILGRLIYSSI